MLHIVCSKFIFTGTQAFFFSHLEESFYLSGLKQNVTL